MWDRIFGTFLALLGAANAVVYTKADEWWLLFCAVLFSIFAVAYLVRGK